MSKTPPEYRLANISKHTTNIVYAKVILALEGDDSDQVKVAELYKKELCKLPTEDLNLILRTTHLYERQPDTVEAIVSELADRTLMREEDGKAVCD